MKVEVVQRSWLANMGLVLRLCLRNFAPLLVVSLVIGLPSLLATYAERGGPSVGPAPGLLLASYSAFASWPVALLLQPLRQVFSIYIVARCFEGVSDRLTFGIRPVARNLVALVFYNLLAWLALFVVAVPGGILSFACGPQGPHVVGIIVSLFTMGIPLAWMAASLALGPASIVMDHKGPISGRTESFTLAKGRYLYLISFLGLLYVLPLLMSFLRNSWKIAGNEFIPHSMDYLLIIEWATIVLGMPLTVAPVVLYFHFKGMGQDVRLTYLARLVDRIGRQHKS